MTDNTTSLSNEQPNIATNTSAEGAQQGAYPYTTAQYGTTQYRTPQYGTPQYGGGYADAPYGGAPHGGYAPYPSAPAGAGVNAAAQAKNTKSTLGGKTIAMIVGIALACGLVGGAGGALAVNALVGQTSSTQMEMQMPGDMDSDMGGMGGFGGQSGDSQSAPDGMSQGGSSDSGQSSGDSADSNNSSSDSDAGTNTFGDSSMTI
ncbi:ethanolamine utilization protein EutL [Bifidobacterium lemurum]|uniref:Ethanolamine utilization protein EutL n=1 Tax=Bifidobacterium lemurum TaxID=1603886 RepID=A0A261FPJ9_9BIFI|nr:hypothetical protein [Bifidobacterium lemurum]OZG60746.1 ethanolamine utilization protein EutL [Bifidobacterium lemurum]QOL35203.1 hypothetical protein BL8807_04950 [Bifidobacterium lemurum]